jgi:polyhydroxyalkanoate synthesis regulator phasin
MPGLSDLAQKAFYLGLGLASAAADKASTQLAELRIQAQKVADELVERGEMTAEEARSFVDSMMRQGEQAHKQGTSGGDPAASGGGPRKINIDDVATPDGSGQIELSEAGKLRREVADLQAELERLRSQK